MSYEPRALERRTMQQFCAVQFVGAFMFLGERMPAGSWLIFGRDVDHRVAVTDSEFQRRFLWFEKVA